ncbi:MAG: VOC family protein [Myxococcota bacterium]
MSHPHPELELAIDHISLSVDDLPRAKAFYEAVLPAVGLELSQELSAEIAGVDCLAFGRGRKGSFWLVATGTQSPKLHVAFRAPSRAAVRAFHEAALAAGGTDNGAPGIREIYHPAYYAAFALDPEGHNIEAVCFEPE